MAKRIKKPVQAVSRGRGRPPKAPGELHAARVEVRTTGEEKAAWEAKAAAAELTISEWLRQLANRAK